MNFRLHIALTTLVSLALAQPARAANFYHLTDLGSLPGANVTGAAYGINDDGQVVGSVRVASWEHAFLWTASGGMQDLGVLPGDVESGARAINDSGQVVGSSSNGPGPGGRAFLWTSAGGMQDLGVLPGADLSHASGINNSGQVVGNSLAYFGPLPSHAFLWTSGGGMQDLGVLPGRDLSYATDINSSGQVVGDSFNIDGQLPRRAFLWTSGGGMTDLGVLPGHESSTALGLNDRGEVVGESGMTNQPARAFLWTSGGGMTDLGVLPGASGSSASAINDNGQVVGKSGEELFLWTSTGGMQDLNSLLDASGAGWTLNYVWAINNAGQIVAWSSNPKDGFRSFVLTPVPEPPVLGFTQFNDPPLGAGTFRPGPASEELGFVTTSSASGGLNPLVGVAVGPEGSDPRVFTHRSINATTTFDAVDLANLDEAFVSLRMQVANTTYEASDFVRVSITNDIDTIDVVNLSGAVPLNDVAGDGFRRYAAAIPDDWSQVALVITSSSNSTQASERYDFDSIEFRAIPEPSSIVIVLLTLALVAASRRASHCGSFRRFIVEGFK